MLFGGDSAEREVSLRSGEAVSTALEQAGLDVTRFDPAAQGLSELAKDTTALIMLHGRGGEDGTIQGALQYLNIPYTGSGVLGSALAMDKVRSKALFVSADLPTAKFKVVTANNLSDLDAEATMNALQGEVMVKPAQEGSSIGMTRVSEADALIEAVETALRYDEQVLLEQYITGREFTVSVLNGKALPAVRMETPRHFYDYEAKYHTDTTQYYCPAGLPAEDEKALAEIALSAFDLVGASGWGRVDVMQDKQGRFYILEVNTVPGMTEKSLVPMAAKAAGLNFTDLVLGILQSSEVKR